MQERGIDRRHFLKLAGAAIVAPALAFKTSQLAAAEELRAWFYLGDTLVLRGPLQVSLDEETVLMTFPYGVAKPLAFNRIEVRQGGLLVYEVNKPLVLTPGDSLTLVMDRRLR